MTRDPLEHEITLELASRARLTLRCLSDREQRWIFSYDYGEKKARGRTPDLLNQVRLDANYENGLLTSQVVLSMYVVIPARLGREFFAGLDISPGAKTFLEFTYAAPISHSTNRVGDAFRLVAICKGARDYVRLDAQEPGIIRPVKFPFPVPDRIAIDYGWIRVPFLTNTGDISHFDLPTSTLR